MFIVEFAAARTKVPPRTLKRPFSAPPPLRDVS
jgi:hypothetical protein